MKLIVAGYKDAAFSTLLADRDGNSRGAIPQRCFECNIPGSARGYYRLQGTLRGTCLIHNVNKFNREGPVVWFTPVEDRNHHEIVTGDLVRVWNGKKPGNQVFMVNQVCRAKPSCCLLSSGEYIPCKELIIEQGGICGS